MKLVRFALIDLVTADDLTINRFDAYSGVMVGVAHTYRPEERRICILSTAVLDLAEIPPLNEAGEIKIPENPLTWADEALLAFADILAVCHHCSRSVFVPKPAVALIPETTADDKFLMGAAGIRLDQSRRSSVILRVDPAEVISLLPDRGSGVAIISEALAQSHATGRFRELWRLFELAFKKQDERLSRLLGEFLGSARDQGFTKKEINRWYEHRKKAIHATIPGGAVTERDSLRIIPRVEQGAYDILLNKTVWNDPSTERSERWIPGGFLISSDLGKVAAYQGSGVQNFPFQHYFDEVSGFPVIFKSWQRHLPDNVWAKICEHVFDMPIKILPPRE